jgi:predicted RNA-binding Zn-ribbon protein involved in translation (DUF1610 family)
LSSSAPPPLADPGEQSEQPNKSPDTHARSHQTESSRTYPCDACGGELHFDIDAQMLKCQHCGNTHELVENVCTVGERDLR